MNNSEFFDKIDFSKATTEKEKSKLIYDNLLNFPNNPSKSLNISWKLISIKKDKTIKDKTQAFKEVASTLGLNDIQVIKSTFSFNYENLLITIKPNNMSVNFNVKIQ